MSNTNDVRREAQRPGYIFTNNGSTPVFVAGCVLNPGQTLEIPVEWLSEGPSKEMQALMKAGVVDIQAVPAQPRPVQFTKFTMPVIKPKGPEKGKPRPDLGERELDL